MTNLTNTELKVLNNLSQVRDPDVLLGAKIQEIIACSGESGTPVNAVASKVTLNITGVSVDGETLTIGGDTYEFLADTAQSKTAPANIAINITSKTVKATGSLTVDTQPTAGDTLTIGTKTYIFVPNGTANADGEISIGADLAEAQDNISYAINGRDEINTEHPLVSASAFVANVCAITAIIGGTIGNSIPTTETFTAGTNVFAAATLGSGTNCTAANTAAVIIAAVNARDTNVVASAGDGNDVLITAKVAGTVGNDLAVSDTMANAAFAAAATKLSGGVNGTVATGTKFMVDATYLYVCLAGNTTAQANWRRVSLGSAY